MAVKIENVEKLIDHIPSQLHEANGSCRVEDVGGRHLLDAPPPGERVVLVPSDRERCALRLRESGDAVSRVVDGDPDHLDLAPALLGELLELRKRFLAGPLHRFSYE